MATAQLTSKGQEWNAPTALAKIHNGQKQKLGTQNTGAVRAPPKVAFETS